MSDQLKLDPARMRAVAGDVDAATETSTRLGARVPGLADGYDLPPDISRVAHAELTSVGAGLRRAADTVRGLGRDVRVRATLAELADQAGKPGSIPPGWRDRLLRLVENFECPLDDPVKKLLQDATTAAAAGAKLGTNQLRDALTSITDGKIAEKLRNTANENLDQCQPPIALPPVLPPPPPPPPKPGLLERVAGTVDEAFEDAADAVRQGVEDVVEQLPDPAESPLFGPFRPGRPPVLPR